MQLFYYIVHYYRIFYLLLEWQERSLLILHTTCKASVPMVGKWNAGIIFRVRFFNFPREDSFDAYLANSSEVSSWKFPLWTLQNARLTSQKDWRWISSINTILKVDNLDHGTDAFWQINESIYSYTSHFCCWFLY